MDRFIRFRSLLFLSPIRQLSLKSFDFKSHLVNHKSNSHFPLPRHIEIKSIPKLHSNYFQEKEFSLKLEIHTYDCSLSLRSELKDLFLNYNVLTQPLTALIITFKTNSDMSTWSIEVENERKNLTEEFNKLAKKMCIYLKSKSYWGDFIDPSNGKPYYGPSTLDTLFETDERLRDFGINSIDLGCCRVVEHLQYGTHVFVGCIFTSASKMDPNLQHLLKDNSDIYSNHFTS